jgi:hypothetical protein
MGTVSDTILEPAEKVLAEMIRDMATGKLPLPYLDIHASEQSIESVHGNATARGMFHGRPCIGIVMLSAKFVAYRSDNSRNPTPLCGSMDE